MKKRIKLISKLFRSDNVLPIFTPVQLLSTSEFGIIEAYDNQKKLYHLALQDEKVSYAYYDYSVHIKHVERSKFKVIKLKSLNKITIEKSLLLNLQDDYVCRNTRTDILRFMELLQKNYVLIPKRLSDETLEENREFETLTDKLLNQ